MNVPKNMGKTDRVLRSMGGVVLATLVYLGLITGVWAVVAGVVAALLMLTSIVGFCPPYALFGWSTCGCGSEGVSSAPGSGGSV